MACAAKSVLHNLGVVLVGFGFAFEGREIDSLLGASRFRSVSLSAPRLICINVLCDRCLHGSFEFADRHAFIGRHVRFRFDREHVYGRERRSCRIRRLGNSLIGDNRFRAHDSVEMTFPCDVLLWIAHTVFQGDMRHIKQ